MKIRKIRIKKHKIFDDIEFDFTDDAGKTLDNIIIVGMNGSGKTTLLKMLMRLFASFRNMYKPFNNFFEGNEFAGSTKISIEIDFLSQEVSLLSGLLKEINHQALKEANKFDEKTLDTHSKLIAKLTKSNILELNYLKEESSQTEIINEFILFDLFSESFKKMTNLKVCYFPAETKLDEDNRTKDDFEELNRNIESSDYGLVRIIDLREHKKYVEKFILQTINEKIYHNRNTPAGEIIKEETEKINNILKDIKLKTKLVDIDTQAPIFESHNKVKIPIHNLSAGEKQVFYRAVYLNSLNLQNSIIMVDEPELSLHPSWQASISKLYTNAGSNNQVILATHSPHIISSTRPENLFVLYLNDQNHKLEVTNMGKAGKHSKGVEPNRILKEIMGTPLRDFETQEKIDYVARNLKKEFDEKRMQELIMELTEALGKEDPFIIRLKNQLILLNRKKSKA